MQASALTAFRRWRRRSLIATLALTAFLFQALLVSYHTPGGSAAERDLLADLQILCAASPGADTAAPGSSDPASDHHKPSSALSHCQICRHTQIAASYLPSSGVALHVPPAEAVPPARPDGRSQVDRYSHLPQNPRGPPALA